MNSMPDFISQTWLKNKNETITTFQRGVHAHIETLAEMGYDVEIEWLNGNDILCVSDEEILLSVKCRVVEKKPYETGDWGIQQRFISKNMQQAKTR